MGGSPEDRKVAVAAAKALAKWVGYITSEQGAWETGVKIYGLPTGFVGRAADLSSRGSRGRQRSEPGMVAAKKKRFHPCRMCR